MADPTLSMKLLIDQKDRRVVFAEAGKDVVDFLFSILSLPLGSVAGHENHKGMAWSIGNLYQSVEDLKDEVVVKYPTTANSPPMLLSSVGQSSFTKKSYYKCAGNSIYANFRTYVTLDHKSRCPTCSSTMSSPLTLVCPTNEWSSSSFSSIEGGFVKGGVTYMIMDDLLVKRMSTISTITLFNRLNLKEVGALEEKTVNLTLDEVGNLLRASLQTKKVFSLKKRWW